MSLEITIIDTKGALMPGLLPYSLCIPLDTSRAIPSIIELAAGFPLLYRKALR